MSRKARSQLVLVVMVPKPGCVAAWSAGQHSQPMALECMPSADPWLSLILSFRLLTLPWMCCRSGTETMSDLMVVTLLVAADADLKIPRIKGREDLRDALNKLGALRSEQVS